MSDKLELRNQMNKRKPKFLRQDIHKKKRLAKNWRKPRGIDSKLRLQLKGHSTIVKVGFKAPKEVRGLTKDGFVEVRVENVNDLSKVNKGCIGVISSKVGAKKKLMIIEVAREKKIPLVNGNEKVVEKINSMLKSKQLKKDARKKKLADKEKKSKDLKKVKKESTKSKPKDSKTSESSETEKKKKDKLLIKKEAN